MQSLLNYINGELVAPISNQYLPNYNPAIGEVYSQIPDSDIRDVALAYDAAKAAFPQWSTAGVGFRAKILEKISLLIEEKLPELALAESIDNGKPLSLSSHIDIPRAAQNFHFFATAIEHFASESHYTEGEAINYTLRTPIGVVGCISPWNLPLYLFTWKIAPALAAGNTIVAKPSEITPMTAFLLQQICIDAGLPKGVLNIVHGLGPKVGQAIVEHPDIPVISFTGGTKTGAGIATTAAPMFKKLSLELGGKNPVLVFDDCDFEEALSTTMRSSFANQGQICLCGSRIYIHASIYDRFRDALVEKTRKLTIGDPLEKTTKTGAVVSKEHMDKVLSYIELAKSEGGKVLVGGNQFKPEGRCKNGWFIEPTIIEGLSHTCRTNQEEIFGPVVTLEKFTTDDEAIVKANSTVYGLASVVWTTNLKRAQNVSLQLKSGIVWVNCWLLRDLRTPFGGVKQSGIGREGGWDALKFFTEPKNVCIKL